MPHLQELTVPGSSQPAAMHQVTIRHHANPRTGSGAIEGCPLRATASIMEGTRLAAGAVAAVEGVRHPVILARLVMERSPHVLLAGAGARSFAREVGAEMCRTRDLLVGRELDRYPRVRVRVGKGSSRL